MNWGLNPTLLLIAIKILMKTDSVWAYSSLTFFKDAMLNQSRLYIGFEKLLKTNSWNLALLPHNYEGHELGPCGQHCFYSVKEYLIFTPATLQKLKNILALVKTYNYL